MDSITSMFSLKGQTAIVTGGTRGIGAAMAIALGEAGADIILIQRNPFDRDTFDAITRLGRRVDVYPADLSNPASVSKIVQELVDTFARINILVNCAGIQHRSPAEKFSSTDWHAIMQVNLTSVFTLCRDFGAYLLSLPIPEPGERRGTIINVASLLSFQGGLTVPAYAASKGGVAQLTKALSNEWSGRGIHVNAIAPGYINTDMNTALIIDKEREKSIMSRIPAGRWGKPEDFKGVVVFLASRASDYVSGEILTVDGGWMGR